MRNRLPPGQNGQSNPKGERLSGTMASQKDTQTHAHKHTHTFTNDMCQYTNAHLISQVGVFSPFCWSLRQTEPDPLATPGGVRVPSMQRWVRRGREGGGCDCTCTWRDGATSSEETLFTYNNSPRRRNLTFREKPAVEKKTRHPQVYCLWRFTGLTRLGPFYSLNGAFYSLS